MLFIENMQRGVKPRLVLKTVLYHPEGEEKDKGMNIIRRIILLSKARRLRRRRDECQARLDEIDKSLDYHLEIRAEAKASFDSLNSLLGLKFINSPQCRDICKMYYDADWAIQALGLAREQAVQEINRIKYLQGKY